MRLGLVFAFLINTLCATAQTELTEMQVVHIINSRIHEANVKVWDAVANGKIKAYATDSLNRTLSLKEIQDKGGKVVQIFHLGATGPEEDVHDTFIPLDNAEDLFGLSLSLTHHIDPNSISTGYNLSAIAPNFWLVAGEFYIAKMPLFWVSIDDFKSCLTFAEWEFFSSLFKQRMQIGDFLGYDLSNSQAITSQTLVDELLWKYSKEYTYFGTLMHLRQTQDTVLGGYNYHLPILHLSNQIALNESLSAHEHSLSRSVNLFQDVSLKNLHGSLTTFEYLEPFNTNVDDSSWVEYGLELNQILKFFQFDDPHRVFIHRQNFEIVIQLAYSEIFNRKAFDICFRLSELKPFMKPHDAIVFEEILKGL